VDGFWQDKLRAIQIHNSQFSGEHLTFVTNYLTKKAMQIANQAAAIAVMQNLLKY